MSLTADRMKELKKQLSALKADRYIVYLTPSKALQAKGKTTYTFGIPGRLGERGKGYKAADLLKDSVLSILGGRNASGYSVGIKCKSQSYHYATLNNVSLEELHKLKANGVQACLVSVVRRNVHREEFFSVVIRFKKTEALGDTTFAQKTAGSYQVKYGEKTQKDLEACIPACGFKDQISGMFVRADRFLDRNCPASQERYETFERLKAASFVPVVIPSKPVNVGDNAFYFELSRELILANAEKAGDKIDHEDINKRLMNKMLNEKYDADEILEFLVNRLKPKASDVCDF